MWRPVATEDHSPEHPLICSRARVRGELAPNWHLPTFALSKHTKRQPRTVILMNLTEKRKTMGYPANFCGCISMNTMPFEEGPW